MAPAQIAAIYQKQYAGLGLCPRLITRRAQILLSCNLSLSLMVLIHITDLISRILIDMHNNRS